MVRTPHQLATLFAIDHSGRAATTCFSRIRHHRFEFDVIHKGKNCFSILVLICIILNDIESFFALDIERFPELLLDVQKLRKVNCAVRSISQPTAHSE